MSEEMKKLRMRFKKQGAASFISHLDLMRMFQRVFLRAGIAVKHTEGFNPHAYVAIALPLPVGHESVCEILDFASGFEPFADIPARLNAVLPKGIEVSAVYEPKRTIKALGFVDNRITLTYDGGVPDGGAAALTELFGQNELVIMKKGKKGAMKELNVSPLIKQIEFTPDGGKTIGVCAVLQAQEPYLNPIYITAVIEKYLPELTPDFAEYRRETLLDSDLNEWE